MQDIQFPVTFQFKVSTLANDFVAKDANGRTIAFVHQKMFKFKEDILIYEDETKAKVIYRIKADKWLDFSAAYTFYDEQGKDFGKILRKGWKSAWKVKYDIVDDGQQIKYKVNEENAWTRIFDSMLGEIPILGFFTGYFFNPSYLVSNMNTEPIVRLKKLPSLLGKSFEVSKVGEMNAEDDDRIMLGLMMMILLERRRG
jgi:hypothetical protein